jgi:ABC-2 type transport system ATP-binding protein
MDSRLEIRGREPSVRPRVDPRAISGYLSPVSTPPGPAISVRHLTKAFRKKVAVDDVSFDVPRGRFFGFLGPNGAGKSTTIKMLTGLLRPTAGEVTIEGLSLEKDLLALKRAIGVLPEELPLYERLTGEEYLHFAGRMYGLGREETRRRTEELLSFLSLADERGKLVVDYSQGMRKKLALAAALIHNPQVLFLDEPLNGIDPVSGRVVTDLLRRLAQKGVTLFFTTHVLDVVERLCDEVAIIDHGRLVAQGTLDQIRAQREVGQDATLEDVFLKLVSAEVRREDLSWIG